ncbi:MAG TPA: hypothetical protein VLF66_08075 [Thermoanaerobaculia bacterium]|nr:hypothetical protein [Thermoanaerobaculia bacterium]
MHRNWLAAGVVAAIFLGSAGPAGAYWFKHCSYGTHWSGQTAMVADINPGPADAVQTIFGFTARQELMAVYKGSLFFQADDGKSGAELWRTAAGAAAQVAELVPGPGGSNPHAFAVFQDQLYFAATTPETGEELFRFDGSTASLAADTYPGTDGGKIFGLTDFDGRLYFARSAPNGDQQVWRFDGTTAEPVTAINAAPGRVAGGGPFPERVFVPFAGKLYYIRDTPLPAHYELWAFDGASASKLKDLTSGDDIVSYNFDLGVYQGALYFGVVAPAPTPQNPWYNVDELWRYTGQGAPTKVATFGAAWSSSQPSYFQTYQGKLYFVVGSELHRYDGSNLENVSAAAQNMPAFPRNLSLYPGAGRLFLSGSSTDWQGNEPYLFDGAGAHLLKDVMPGAPGSYPTFAEEADGLYFFAEDDTHGRELWRVTGQAIPLLDCYIVVAPIWENWLDWPMQRRPVVVATWFVAPDGEARLVSRERATVTPDETWRTRVLSVDTRRQELPEGFALATVVFDRRTGQQVDQGFEVVGVPEPRARERMEATGQRLLRDRSLREVASERLRPMGTHRRPGR